MFAYSVNNEYRGLNYIWLDFVIETPSYFIITNLAGACIFEGTPMLIVSICLNFW